MHSIFILTILILLESAESFSVESLAFSSDVDACQNFPDFACRNLQFDPRVSRNGQQEAHRQFRDLLYTNLKRKNDSLLNFLECCANRDNDTLKLFLAETLKIWRKNLTDTKLIARLHRKLGYGSIFEIKIQQSGRYGNVLHILPIRNMVSLDRNLVEQFILHVFNISKSLPNLRPNREWQNFLDFDHAMKEKVVDEDQPLIAKGYHLAIFSNQSDNDFFGEYFTTLLNEPKRWRFSNASFMIEKSFRAKILRLLRYYDPKIILAHGLYNFYVKYFLINTCEDLMEKVFPARIARFLFTEMYSMETFSHDVKVMLSNMKLSWKNHVIANGILKADIIDLLDNVTLVDPFPTWVLDKKVFHKYQLITYDKSKSFVSNLINLSSMNQRMELFKFLNAKVPFEPDQRDLIFGPGAMINQFQEIILTLGSCLPPFFDPTQPLPLKYGLLGSLIGHELGHVIIDHSNIDNCIRHQIKNLSVDHHEMFADIMAVQLSFTAYKIATLVAESAHFDSHSNYGEVFNDRLFFLAYGRVFCESKSFEQKQWGSDNQIEEYGLFNARLNISVSNSVNFMKTFRCARKNIVGDQLCSLKNVVHEINDQKRHK